jgi:hypothetical protein
MYVFLLHDNFSLAGPSLKNTISKHERNMHHTQELDQIWSKSKGHYFKTFNNKYKQ